MVDNKVIPPPPAEAPSALENIDTPAAVKYKVPLSYCARAKVDAVLTVAVPAVIVDIPAPIFCINTVSPAENQLVLTVIVVALAEFIITVAPASAATNV